MGFNRFKTAKDAVWHVPLLGATRTPFGSKGWERSVFKQRGMRVFAAFACAGAAVAVVGSSHVDSSMASSAREPKVICITELGDPGFGAYRYKPGQCTFGERGEPAYGYSTTPTSSMRWKRWGNRKTVGHGRVGISTVGAERVKVILSRKRERCGREVYTHARFIVHVRYQGQEDRLNWSQPLDLCLT